MKKIELLLIALFVVMGVSGQNETLMTINGESIPASEFMYIYSKNNQEKSIDPKSMDDLGFDVLLGGGQGLGQPGIFGGGLVQPRHQRIASVPEFHNGIGAGVFDGTLADTVADDGDEGVVDCRNGGPLKILGGFAEIVLDGSLADDFGGGVDGPQLDLALPAEGAVVDPGALDGAQGGYFLAAAEDAQGRAFDALLVRRGQLLQIGSRYGVLVGHCATSSGDSVAGNPGSGRGFPPLSPGFVAVDIGKCACYDFVNSRGTPGDTGNTPFGHCNKMGRRCQRKTTAEVQFMTREEMIAEIMRVLEDANEWEVAEIHAFVMDEVD